MSKRFTPSLNLICYGSQLNDNTVASSSNRRALWPFVLKWVSQETRPSKPPGRALRSEYLAGLGMIDVNARRRLNRLPLLTHATIINDIHESVSDNDPHITIAAATDEMRSQGTHIAVHCRVTSNHADEACFAGGEDFPKNIKQDTTDLRQSYTNTLYARASLLSDNIHSAPVGYIINYYGDAQWYVLNDELNPVYLKETKFYRAGEGTTEHLVFLNPITNAPCRAMFLGNERPVPHSPDPEPTNLGVAMTNLSLAPTEELVAPYIDLGRVNTPLVFETNNNTGEWTKIRTSWQSWYAENCDGYVVFKYDGVGRVRGRVFCTSEMPVVVVHPYMVRSSSRPIQFVGPEPEMEVFKTKRSKWMSGMNNCFFVYLEKAVYYLALILPGETDH